MATAETRRLVGLRLKAARMALGYGERRRRNQTAFYRLFGKSIGRANNWERGVSFPDPEFLIELCDRFEIGPDWVYCGRAGGLPSRIADQIVDNFSKLKANG